MITGLRTLGNNTPIINSWAGDGNYWLPKSPPVTNYYFVTYASIFGDDPNPAVNKLAKQVKAGTGGFITGSAAIDGVVTAIRRSGGSTNGATLAATLEKFKGVPTLSGKVSFSPKLHSVFGRQYRVIKIQNNKARSRRHGRRQGRREDLSDLAVDTTQLESERRPGETLRASSVSRSFEGVQALRGVSLTLGRGEVVGLIGPNGAGKSTLVNVLSGFDRPDDGTVELAGQDVTRWSPHRRGRQGTRADVSAQPRVPRPVGARERRGVGARSRRAAARGGAPRATRCSSGSASTATRTRPRRRSPTATSGGSASHARSRPSRRSCCSTSRRLACPRRRCRTSPRSCARSRREHGAGVLLIDHNMALIMETCDRIQVLDQGTVLAEGTPAEIRANLDVAAAYLGETPVPENDAHRRRPRRPLRRRARGPRPVVHRRAG